MSSSLLVLPISFLLVRSAVGIECYSGLKLIAGQSVGTTTIDCPNTGSQCYNMTASAAVVLDVVKAGCSLWRCMLARDRCISTTFQNVPISLCCCSGDRCNVGDNVGMKQVSGWNAEPNHRGDQLTREEIHSRFNSAEVDDDAAIAATRGNRHGGSRGERPHGSPGGDFGLN